MQMNTRQRAAFRAIRTALHAGQRRQLVCLPTGVGKTVLGAHLAAKFPSALFLCHREELLRQTLRTMRVVAPAVAQGVIAPGQHNLAPFTVGLIQTVHRRLDRLDPDAFGLIIIDEAHHAVAKTWRATVEHFRPRLLLGLSATPERLDGAPLSDLFAGITYAMTIGEAVAEGLLVRPICVQVRTRVSLAGVRETGGDFREDDLQRALDTPARNALVVERYQRHAAGRKAICFTAGVAHARTLAAAFQQAGIPADAVAGDDPARAAKLTALAEGRLTVVCNAQLLCEGFDEPSLGAVILARPTQSRTLFAQMIGRGLRLCRGKTNCVILDFADTATSHLLMSAWRFFGQPGEPRDDQVFNPLVPSERAARRRAAQRRATELFGGDLELDAIDRWLDLLKPPPTVPTFAVGSAAWHHNPATAKQVVTLASCGYDANDWTCGQAAAVIVRLPASPKQLNLLLAQGFDVLSCDWTREQASRALAGVIGQTPDWSRLRQLQAPRGAGRSAEEAR